MIDEVIHSGEIVEPRSMIVRSSESLNKVEVREDPTEPTRVPSMPMAPPRSLRFLWLVAAIIPAAIAGALMLVKPSSTSSAPSTVGLQATAELIGTTLDAEARGAQVRAEAFASAPKLRAGIQTDTQTLADMAKDSAFSFPVDHGEMLDLVQIHDGARTSLLRIPSSAPPLKAPVAGTAQLEARGGGIAVLANAAVATETGIGGEVVMSLPIDLEPIKKRVAGQAVQVSLVGLGAPIVLASEAGKTGTTVSVPIDTKLVKPGSLSLSAVIAAAPASGSDPLKLVRYACLGIAGLLLLVFVGSKFRR